MTRSGVVPAKRVALFALLLCFSASVSVAEIIILGPPVPFSTLENGGLLTVGDKVFSEFNYAKTEDMPTSDAVNVIPISAHGAFGLRFQAGFIDLPGGSPSDALITYRVSVVPGSGKLISGANLAGNPDVIGGNGLASVTETFLPTLPMDTLTIFNNGVIADLAASIEFGQPVSTLQVQKNIIMFAGQDSVAAVMSFVDQTFPQIPEPACGTMLLFAVVVAVRRCRYSGS